MKSLFFPRESMDFQPHPKFQGVALAKLVTKELREEIGVSLLAIEPGVEIPVHVHEGEVDSIYVASGSGEAYVNGEWRSVSAGDYIFVPKGVEHGVRNSGEGVLELFVVHAPPLM